MTKNDNLPSDLQELIARAEQDQKDQKKEKKEDEKISESKG
jgi:hypothetical protein